MCGSSCVFVVRTHHVSSSCVSFDSFRLLHFHLFAHHLLSYHPVLSLTRQLHLPGCGGQIPCALSLMRTLAPLPSTTLSHLQPTPDAAAADQQHFPDSSRKVRRTRSSRSPSRCLDNGRECEYLLVRLVMASLGSSQPLVSRQQVVLVLAPICESYAMAKEKKPDSGRVLSPGCRPQPHGHLRDGNHISRDAASKRRHARRRIDAVLTAFPAAGDLFRSQSIRTSRRGIASCECAILPIREIVSHSRCSVCQQTSSGERPTEPERRNDASDADASPFLPRFLLQELIFAHCPSASGSHTHSRKLRERIGLALSQRNRTHRVRHLADPDDRQLSAAWSWQLDPLLKVDCTGYMFATETPTSVNTALSGAFWLRNQEEQLSYVGTVKTVGSGHTGSTSTSASIAYPGCFVVTKPERKKHNPRGNGRVARPGRITSCSPVRTINSANRAALRNSASCPSEITTAVRIKQHSGVRVSRNKQLLPSLIIL